MYVSYTIYLKLLIKTIYNAVLHTYATVYLSAHPAETIELLKYIQTGKIVNRGSYMYILKEVWYLVSST